MRGYFFIISALAIWSTWGLAIRWLDMPVAAIVFYTALFALMFQGTALLVVGRRRKLGMGRGLGAILLMGGSGLANVLLVFYSMKVIPIAGALLTHYTAPVFVAVLAPFLLRDRMGRATSAALILSILGLALIFMRGLDLGGSGLPGALAGTGSGLAYALLIIIARVIADRHHPLKLSFYQALISVVILAPFVLPDGAAYLTLPRLLLFAVLGLAHSATANMLYFHGLRTVTAQEAGVLGYIEPVLAIALAFLFLGETPHPLAMLGGALIVASGLMVFMYGGKTDMGVVDDNRG